jgi:hypothetical protein
MQQKRRATILALSCALALLSGAVWMAGWVAAAECEAGSCVKPGGPDAAEGVATLPASPGEDNGLEHYVSQLQEAQGEEKLEAVLQLWRYAADHGVPAAALKALEDVAQDQDAAVSQQAVLALEDLQRLQDSLASAPKTLAGYNNPNDPAGHELESPKDTPEAQARAAALAQAARSEPDDTWRANAVDELVIQRRDDTLVVLIEVAVSDAVLDIRYRALEALWYAAADGLDSRGLIQDTLEGALADPEPRIAALAERALEDLRTLKE